MNRKQLTLLIVLGVVLGGLGWFAYQKQQSPYQDSKQRMGELLLPKFPLNDVAQVRLKQGPTELNLIQKDGSWIVKERGEYLADFGKVSEILRKAWELKITKPVEVGPSRLAKLELVAPDKGPGTLVEFKDKAGKPIQSLLLGAKHMKESAGNSPYGGGSWPDGRYVMVGDDIKSVALVSDPLSNTDPKAEEWLDKEFFKVERLRSIAITTTNATNNWKLTRESETGEWKLADVKADEQLDTGKSGGVTAALGSPTFNDVVTDAAPEKTGLNQPLVARLETFDDFTYAVKIGNKTGEDAYHFQVAVSASLPKERTPGKEEKPEDKAKLDKEFQDKVKRLEEKLKKEKAFEKWIYVVSKWTIDPLLKERKDLLAEKKDEPKPADSSATGAPVDSPLVPPVTVPLKPQ